MSNILLEISLLKIVSIGILFIGILLLIFSISMVSSFSSILKSNEYDTKRWQIIIFLVILFILGFCIHIFTVVGLFKSTVIINFVISIVYLFGSIFAYKVIQSSDVLVKNILGNTISNNSAFEIALEELNMNVDDLSHLYDQFSIKCDSCKKELIYTIADVVRQHSNIKGRGISVENTFGVKSIFLRPAHKCNDGRREIVTIHDKNMAYRSIDKSTIIIGNEL